MKCNTDSCNNEVPDGFRANKKYCSEKCRIKNKGKKYAETGKRALIHAVNRAFFKEMCVKYKGGKCERCNLVVNNCSFDFHHINPNEKDFGIAKLEISKNKLDNIPDFVILELDKCMLLCSNCHMEEHEILRVVSEKQSNICIYGECVNQKSYDDKFCSNNCKNKYRISNYRRVLKFKAIAYKGGICHMCGYLKCNGALAFHHRDPSQKDFSLGNNGNIISWDKIKIELDKCDLLCHNCHRDLHAKINSDRRALGDI